jgi:hypothetical protein
MTQELWMDELVHNWNSQKVIIIHPSACGPSIMVRYGQEHNEKNCLPFHTSSILHGALVTPEIVLICLLHTLYNRKSFLYHSDWDLKSSVLMNLWIFLPSSSLISP